MKRILSFFRGKTAARSVLKRRRSASKVSAAYKKHKEHARALVHARLAELNRHYGFAYGRVAIRDQRSRWGSCSAKGNLNFNYRVVHLPLELLDYVVAHELCHLEEFNHSKRFWDLVARTVPDHKDKRRMLKNRPFHGLFRVFSR